MVPIARVQNILLKPNKEWRAIAREPGAIVSIFKNYVVPLAAIGPVASMIGGVIVGAPIIAAIFAALIGFLVSVLSVYLFAIVVNALAPRFGGEPDPVRATKLAAYAWTPAALGGLFGLVPTFALIGTLVALYGFYLLYAGLPVMMKSPRDRAVIYAAASAGCCVGIGLVMGLVMMMLTWAVV